MTNIIKILTTHRQKIPSWKVDIGPILALTNTLKPRKTQISGHFRLITVIIFDFYVFNPLIF
jgi:hypothetical protein